MTISIFFFFYKIKLLFTCPNHLYFNIQVDPVLILSLFAIRSILCSFCFLLSIGVGGAGEFLSRMLFQDSLACQFLFEICHEDLGWRVLCSRKEEEGAREFLSLYFPNPREDYSAPPPTLYFIYASILLLIILFHNKYI